MKIYTMTEAYGLAGLSKHTGQVMDSLGLIPKPDCQGGRGHYSEAGLKQLQKEAKHNKLIKVHRLTQALNITRKAWQRMVATGQFPKPPVEVGVCGSYFERDIPRLQKLADKLNTEPNGHAGQWHQQRRDGGYYSVGDISEACGVGRVSIQHHIKHKRFEPPTHKWGNSPYLYYNQEEYEAWLRFFSGPKGMAGKHQQRRDSGYYSITDMAKLVGVTTQTIRYHCKRGHIPEPSHTYPNCHGVFYSAGDKAQILRFFSESK